MGKQKLAIDLFSGCGGLSLGLEKAGFRMVGAVEMDALAVSTFRMNFPKCKVWKQDIKTLSPRSMRKKLNLKKGELDLLAGCPPCQGFSTLRTHHRVSSVKEPMNDLIFQVLEFIKEFEPKAVMIENVPGLAKDSRIRNFTRALLKLGYSCDYKVHDAKDYGTPQNRKRMIFIGFKGDMPAFAPPVKKQKNVRDAIGKLQIPGQGNDPLHDYEVTRTPRIEKMISLIPKDGGSRKSLPEEFKLPCHKRNSGFNDVYGRMSWDKPSPTITCGCINPSKGRFLHPEQDRAITAREAAMLQGFPKKFKFDISKGLYATAHMIGNAFPPTFAEKHARQIAKLV